MGALFPSAMGLMAGLVALTSGAGPVAKSPALAVPKEANKVVFIAQPNQALDGTSEFLKATARHSALLSPTTIQRFFAPTLPPGTDILDPASLQASGIDVARPFSLYEIGGQWVGCYTVVPSVFSGASQIQASEKDQGFQVVTASEKNLTTWTITDSFNATRRVVLTKGKEACITGGGARVRSAVDGAKWVLRGSKKSQEKSSLRDALTSALKGTTAQHVVIGIMRSKDNVVAAALKPSGKTPGLEVDGVTSGRDKLFASKASSAVLDIVPPSESVPALFDITLAPTMSDNLTPILQRILRRSLPNVSDKERESMIREILPSLQGRALMAISGVNPNHPAGSIHQVRQAVFARVNDPQKLTLLLNKVASKFASSTATPLTTGGHVATFEGAPAWFGIKGNTFYFANDNDLAAQMLAGSDGAHLPITNEAMTLAIDGPEFARLLSKVSMFHLAQGKLFQQLFALKMDFTGLLQRAGLILVTASQKNRWMTFHGDMDLSGKCAPCELSKRAAERQKKRPSSK